ncbi:hypothetical protein XA68_12297 [Ophiocordyceps unilateralis]|uniref:Uncharacterized protein n=1 Tax=Ophiocordyceps unilateralis TaxID=268505 RepID=A0A2A9PD84_OPHUN|nr:hypothetical protein XA68_12297 [Ophiocordyceps unilateralis]
MDSSTTPWGGCFCSGLLSGSTLHVRTRLASTLVPCNRSTTSRCIWAQLTWVPLLEAAALDGLLPLGLLLPPPAPPPLPPPPPPHFPPHFGLPWPESGYSRLQVQSAASRLVAYQRLP